jgi:hypothetical protein
MLLVRKANLAPAGAGLSLVAALSFSTTSKSSVGRKGLSAAGAAAAGAGAAVGAAAAGAGAAVGAAGAAGVGACPQAAMISISTASGPRSFREREVILIVFLSSALAPSVERLHGDIAYVSGDNPPFVYLQRD